MTDAGYIFAGYAATAGILGAYAVWVIRRRRTLSTFLRPNEDGVAPPANRCLAPPANR